MELHTKDFNPPMRAGIHPTKPPPPLSPAPPLKHESRVLEDGETLFEKDIPITMRDGVKLYANSFRPVQHLVAQTPTIVLFSPFGKHGAVPRELFKNMGIDTSKQSDYTLWELPDPFIWCAEYQYSLLIVDARGTWWSEGEAAYYFSPEEGRDGYDIVEWVAHQPWNTGKVGWGAVSYFAMSAYQVAALKPPHLTAIMPWEGMSDIYREVNVVGGIPTVTFQHFWMSLTGNGLRANEDAATMAIEQPMFTPLWASKVVDWSKIDIPAFSITGWSSLTLHLRGTIAAWKGFQSKNKYLWVHAGREWAVYYSDLGQKRQKAFWDRFLKGQHTQVDDWKPIELDVRERCGQSVTRSEQSWPPPASRLTAFVLDCESKLAQASATGPNEAASVSFFSHLAGSSVHWGHMFASRTEITGDSSLKLFIQAMGYPDADLYVAVQKLDRDGQHVQFYNQTQLVEASAMHGWLRVSHREKDEAASRPGRPVHLHQRRQWLRPCDVVEVEVELWPSSTVWEEGETLRLVVQGHSFFTDTSPVTNRNANSHNYGEVKVWFGGQYDSHLLLPLVSSQMQLMTTDGIYLSSRRKKP